MSRKMVRTRNLLRAIVLHYFNLIRLCILEMSFIKCKSLRQSIDFSSFFLKGLRSGFGYVWFKISMRMNIRIFCPFKLEMKTTKEVRKADISLRTVVNLSHQYSQKKEKWVNQSRLFSTFIVVATWIKFRSLFFVSHCNSKEKNL